MINYIVLALLVFVSSCGGKDYGKEIGKRKGKLSIIKHKLGSGFLSRTLQISFEHTLNKCSFSDNDLMHIDKKFSKVKKHILTLERIDKKESPLFYSSIDITNYSPLSLEAGGLSRFSDVNGIYGIFICSDKSNSGSCKNKTSYEFNSLIEKLFRKNKAKELKKDKIFIFKPVVITGDSLYIINNIPKDPKAFRNVLQVLVKDKKKRAKIYNYAEGVDANLRNYGIHSDKAYLQVDVAKIDPVCNKKKMMKLYTAPRTKTMLKKLEKSLDKMNK